MRTILRHWPLRRGKGKLMAGFAPLLRDRKFLMEVEPGIVVRGRLEEYAILWGFMHGYDSSTEWALSRELIRAGDVVFDVGANQGLWLLSAAARIGPAGAAHAFEPVERNASRLEENVTLNGFEDRVTLTRAALADRVGYDTFYEAPHGDSGKGRLAPRSMLRATEKVELTTLDSYCEERAVERVDFMKVDVEGAEELVFRGGASLLSADRAPIVLFESIDRLARSFDSSSAAVKALLRDFGYRVYRQDGRALRSVSTDVSHGQDDLFALKSGHLETRPELAQLVAD